MTVARQSHTATLLPNEMVLIAGGDEFDSAELYDPNAGTFAATGSMTVARQSHTATLLPNGKVLIVGGLNYAHDTMNSTPPPFVSPELYDPAAGTFSATGNVTVARRQNHTATLLHNGMVLIAGGNGDAGGLASADVYDQRLENFQSPGACPRQGHGTRQRCCETATYSSPAERLPTTPLSYSTGLSRAWNYANSAERECHSFRVAPPCRDFVASNGLVTM